MEQRSNAKGVWYSHWVASEQRYCKGKEPCNRAEGFGPPPPPEEETTIRRKGGSPAYRPARLSHKNFTRLSNASNLLGQSAKSSSAS